VMPGVMPGAAAGGSTLPRICASGSLVLVVGDGAQR
jgi:hypothetical protein